MSRWPRVAFIVGWVLVVSGFCVGVQPTAATSHGRQYGCAAVIPTSWLVAGAPSSSPSSSDSPRDQRRAAAACHSPVVRAHLLTWGLLGIGGLVVLTGGTVLRERASSSGDHLVVASA